MDNRPEMYESAWATFNAVNGEADGISMADLMVYWAVVMPKIAELKAAQDAAAAAE